MTTRIKTTKLRTILVASLLAVIAMPQPQAGAIDLQDIVRVKGMERNSVMGMGLVIGLNGTGDSTKKSPRVTRPLYELYKTFAVGIESFEELAGVDSAALVYIRCEIPATGTREGNRLDVIVSVAGDATSLAGGELVRTPLKAGRFGVPYAVAEGRIEVDPTNPRRGVITNGAQMLHDIRTNPVDEVSRSITLVIKDKYAGYPAAAAIANRITQHFQIKRSKVGEVWAIAEDASNVRIHLGNWKGDDIATLMRGVLSLDLDASLLDIPARVVINRSRGVITVTGDVVISPTVITSRNLTITSINPPPRPTVENPAFETRSQVALSTIPDLLPGQEATLADLLAALESLKVPFDEKADILKQMHQAGTLHGELVIVE